MATSEAEVQAAVTSVNASYADAAKRDILNALSEFCDLYPSTDSYVFNDGSCQKVVTLSGTVPVSYKGNTYNIPICLYLLDTHPYNAPICYVRPTPGMMIKTSQHVDHSGKVYLPYLHEWRHPKSDLLGLLQVMSIVFSEHCPVFAKSASTAVLPPTSNVGAGSLTGGNEYAPHLGITGSNAAPSPPGTGSGLYNTYQPMAIGVSRPLPPFGAFIPSANNSTSTTPATFASYSGFATTSAYSGPRPHVPMLIQSEHARSNLISAVEEKLRAKLRESIGTLHTELQSIRKTREDLIAGEQKLKTITAKMKEEQDYLDSAVSTLKITVDDMDKILTEAGAGDETQIDDAIDTTAPLFRQLLNSYVEDNSIEDTIYFLGQALKRGRMDLENYLKHVRVLSRQQFMLRATMQRCRRAARLDS